MNSFRKGTYLELLNVLLKLYINVKFQSKFLLPEILLRISLLYKYIKENGDFLLAKTTFPVK